MSLDDAIEHAAAWLKAKREELQAMDEVALRVWCIQENLPCVPGNKQKTIEGVMSHLATVEGNKQIVTGKTKATGQADEFVHCLIEPFIHCARFSLASAV